jgi:hypothetical protein
VALVQASCEANTSKSTPSTIQVDDNTYYFYKGDTIKVGVISTLHIRLTSTIGLANMILLAWNTNGGVCGNDMLVVEGSDRFVDVSCLAGNKVNQIRIVTAQALVTTHTKETQFLTFIRWCCLVKAKVYCLVLSFWGRH